MTDNYLQNLCLLGEATNFWDQFSQLLTETNHNKNAVGFQTRVFDGSKYFENIIDLYYLVTIDTESTIRIKLRDISVYLQNIPIFHEETFFNFH